MSTYLQGFQAYIPQIQPFTPDYNFYQGALEMKQNQYDSAKKQLSTMYGSLLNAPLTREDNIEARDKFFKAIDQDIKKMSGMDLSLAQNSEAAMGVFNQLTDNKNIAHDMVFTKQLQGQFQKSQYLKNCVDPEKCGGGWWQGGERLLSHAAEDYKRASKQDALNMAAPGYVAHQNIYEKAMKIAKDLDMNITVDQKSGGYIVTTKNGALAEPHMQNMLFGTLGNDPKIAEYYNASAKLSRLDFMQMNEAQYGSREAAEQAYIQTILGQRKQEENQKLQEALEDKVSTNEKKAKQLEEKKKNLLPDERSSIERMLDDLQESAVGYQTSLDKVKQENERARIIQASDTGYTGADIDALVASSSLQNDIVGAAHSLAYKNYEQTMKADQFALESTKFNHQWQLKQLQHILDKDLKQFEHDLDKELNEISQKGTAEHNIPTINEEGVKGSSSVIDDEDALAERGYDAISEVVEGTMMDLSASEKLILQEVMNRTSAEAAAGNVQAQEDYVNMVLQMALAQGEDVGLLGVEKQDAIESARGGSTDLDWESMWDFSKISEDVSKEQWVKGMADNIPLAKKYEMAKKYANLISLDKIEGNQVDYMYDQVMPGLTSMDDDKKYTRDYLQPIWLNENIKNARINIEAKNAHLDQMKEWYVQKTKDVAAAVRTDADFTIDGIIDPSVSEEWGDMNIFSRYWNNNESSIPQTTVADAIESYIDANGNVQTMDEFVASMKAKGHSKATATALWGGTKVDPHLGHYVMSWGNAAGTTLLGIADNTLDVLGTIAGNGWLWGDGADWTDYGYDYDGAAAMANWMEAGEGENESYAGLTIHDMYRQAVTKYGKPDGDMAWMNVTGAGNYAAKAQNYNIIDPAVSTSVGVMGMKGIFTDFQRGSSVAKVGGFEVDNGGETDDAAVAMLNAYQTSFYGTPTGANRPLVSATYSDVANSDANTIGINIKFDQKYMSKFKGTSTNPSILGDSYNDIAANGITLYMPKDGAQNIFTTASQKTSAEHLMGLTGKIDMTPVAGEYAKDFQIKAMDNGTYVSAGMVQTGLNENGTKKYEYVQFTHPAMTDINDLMSNLDNLLGQVRFQNEAIRKQWLAENMAKL